MKIEEAIQRLETHKEYISPHGRFTKEAIDMAIEALEKQIPKKPVKSIKPRYGMGYDYYDWECPTCGSFLAFEPDLDRLKKVHHCKCGQAINYAED